MAKKIILAIFFIEKSQAKSIIKDMLTTKFYIKNIQDLFYRNTL